MAELWTNLHAATMRDGALPHDALPHDAMTDAAALVGEAAA